MIQAALGKDCERSGRFSRWLMGAAALVAAALLVGLAEPSTAAQAGGEGAIPGATYVGLIEITEEGCDGAPINASIDFLLVVSEDGASIEQIALTGASEDGEGFDLEEPIVVEELSIAIAEDGSFSSSFVVDLFDLRTLIDLDPPTDGATPTPPVGSIALTFLFSGVFAGEQLSGVLSIMPTPCNDLEFTAQAVEEATEPTTVPAEPTTVPAVSALPSTGSGPTADSNGTALWAILAAIVSAAVLGSMGLAVVRRRRA